MTTQPDILIVGAGIFGITAALELHERGWRVTVIDPGPIPHPLAESTDISKVVRRTYGDDVDYTALGEESAEGWRRWNETLFGEELFHPVGVTYLTRAPMQPGGFEYESFKLLKERGNRVERLEGTTIQARYPAFSAIFCDGFVAPDDGYAESGRVVAKLARVAASRGIVLHPGQLAEKLIETDGRIEGVRTAQGNEFRAGHTLIAAGAWTPYLAPQLVPYMRTTGQPVFHLKPHDPEHFAAPRFPVWSDDATASGWYGFPLHPREGVVKLGHHGDGRLTHPSNGQRVVLPEEEQMLRDFLKIGIPDLVDAPIVYTRLCIYCDTLDQHFWIDRAPHVEGLTVAAGGSGHAFKFAPVIGGLIADAVEGKSNPYRTKFAWRDLAPETEGEEGRRYRR
jgi:sarcosine oxidase / L-pipecolate oxidase